MASEAAPRRAVRNIAEIVALEQEEIRRRPPSSQPADAVARFAGTPLFVLLRALAIGTYVVVNAGMVPGVPAFDPFPYGLLGGFFSLEGVLVAAFVLMKQNRADARAGERAHLDPRISLLAVTTVGGLASKLHESLHPEERDDGSA